MMTAGRWPGRRFGGVRCGGQRLGVRVLCLRLSFGAGLGIEGVHDSACFQEAGVRGVQKWLWTACRARKLCGTMSSLAKFFKLSPGVSQGGVRIEDELFAVRGDAS